jgi:hypothetical protein
MNRLELVKRLAEYATRPVDGGEEPREDAANDVYAAHAAAAEAAPGPGANDLFVWFEDTSARARDSRRGIAGLPESLLPYSRGLKVVDRRYVEGHFHLLSAARLRCNDRFGERIAALYTAALSVGTIAWIGTGVQYERAWREMFPYASERGLDVKRS